MLDTVEGAALRHADYYFAMTKKTLMILIYLHLTVSVEMSKPRRSNGILLWGGGGDSFGSVGRDFIKLAFIRVEIEF